MSDIRGSNAPGEITIGNMGKIVGAVIVIAAFAAAGLYSYKAGTWTQPPPQKVSDSQLPSPTAPVLLTTPAPKPSHRAPAPQQQQPISDRNQPVSLTPRPAQDI